MAEYENIELELMIILRLSLYSLVIPADMPCNMGSSAPSSRSATEDGMRPMGYGLSRSISRDEQKN